ncbi:MAG: hypothetical protein JWR75_396 [Devosia sp.]|nr:hypothetical protein [Devosia sp.]
MTPTPRLSVGLLLTFAAGFIDAIGFIELGGFYTSFMSGNTTQLGGAIAMGAWPIVLVTASLVGLFLLGSVAGSMLALIDARWSPGAVVLLVLVILGVTAVMIRAGLPPSQSMLALAAAAGAQNAIVPAAGSVRLGTTFVTGTLFAAGQDFARALFRQAPPLRWAQHLLVWLSLLLGGLLGAAAYAIAGTLALLLPALVYVGFLIGFTVSGLRHSGRPLHL